MRFGPAFRRLIAALLVALAAPVHAQFPSLSDMVGPEEKAMLPAFAQAVAAPPAERLARLEALLMRLDKPTTLRGVVQLARAEELMRAIRPAEGVAAIEEALRLVPNHPMPKLMATGVFIFGGQPARAADLWLSASRELPAVANRIDEYTVSALIGRLEETGDLRRADLFRERLVETGYAGGTATQRSNRVLAVIRSRLAAGRVGEERALVPQLVSVGDFIAVTTDRASEPLWEATADWAGADFGKQRAIELETLRREWNGSKGVRQGVAYARALMSAGAEGAVIALFRPVVDAADAGAQQDIEYLAPIVATALVRTKRAADGVALLDRARRDWTALALARRVNLSANLALTLARTDRFGEAADTYARMIADARPLGPQMNSSALMAIEAGRVCVLHAAKREGEAVPSLTAVLLASPLLPGPAASVHACLGDEAAFRALVLEALSDPNRRRWAIGIMQPDGLPPVGAIETRQRAFRDRMRADPALRRVVEKVGRILPRDYTFGLPEGFDPLAG